MENNKHQDKTKLKVEKLQAFATGLQLVMNPRLVPGPSRLEAVISFEDNEKYEDEPVVEEVRAEIAE